MNKTLTRFAVAVLAVTAASAFTTAHAGAQPAELAAGPTAAQVKAAVAKCTKQLSSGKYAHDAGGSSTVPVCKTKDAVHWKADFDIDCDGQVTTKCNKQTDPYFQPETAWQQSNGKHLNSAALPFVVVPGISSRWSWKAAGITGGTVAAVVYKDKLVYAVVGDIGPTAIIGEGSYRLAELLGINPHPSTGGIGGSVVDFVLFPGVKASQIENQTSAQTLGAAAATKLVG
ncbi:glycoside hydrolase family 75 protein [Allokutzneria sp. A3M-2-11 16]|uniref:glycoside hydrolase family 75 protein n=1 Tax=Allokutzneria sp. A3M-2-11 16 TaxID=2962043 RepID=UPI0020B8DCD1|nr:glycoside hydrolase family 75 protein [Allokutzneria sp. A3M-2-11 16]MCP3797787.1 glycoside hydrolase family 75 protein [Allokutzneria sp. A3M-2-11 16]